MTSEELRSVMKLLTRVFSTGSMVSGGTRSCEAWAMNCISLVTSERIEWEIWIKVVDQLNHSMSKANFSIFFIHTSLMRLKKALDVGIKIQYEQRVQSNQSRDNIQSHHLDFKSVVLLLQILEQFFRESLCIVNQLETWEIKARPLGLLFLWFLKQV